MGTTPRLSTMLRAGEGKRMLTKSLKVSPDRFEYLEARAREEGVSVSELLNRYTQHDETMQRKPGTQEPDPVAAEVNRCHEIIHDALRDGAIDPLESSAIARATVRTADVILNRRTA